MSQKRRAGENTEWRRGVGLRSPTSGAGISFARRDFFRSCGKICPYKPYVPAFVGEDVSDKFDIAYRDVFDTVPVGSFDFHGDGYTIEAQMAFGLAPHLRGE